MDSGGDEEGERVGVGAGDSGGDSRFLLNRNAVDSVELSYDRVEVEFVRAAA